MRSFGIFIGALFVLTGCLKADVNYYQPPCATNDDCPFDWECMADRCISPETSDEFIPKPTSTDGASDGDVATDAGRTDGASDGDVATDAGGTDGASDGDVATDAGGTDGASDGDVMTDAGGTDGTSDGSNDAGTPTDYDSDGDNDFVDDDDDNDGVSDDLDACDIESGVMSELGWTSTPATDHDGDGCKDHNPEGLNEDFDDDNDGVPDVIDNCSRGEIGWVSDTTTDIDLDGCKNEEDADTDGDFIPDEQQPYFSEGYKLLAAGPESLCALHESNIIHCIAHDNPQLTEGARPYVLTPFEQVELTYASYIALQEQKVVCDEDATCPSEVNFAQISAGYAEGCGIDEDGGLHCWVLFGGYSSSIVSQMPDEGTYTYVEAGTNMACAIKTDETVVCWGTVYDSVGGTIDNLAPPVSSDTNLAHKFTTIDVGENFACGITDANLVKCWPEAKLPSELSIPDGQFQNITVGSSHYCARVKEGATLTCSGLPGLDSDSFPLPSPVPFFSHLVSGNRFSCGLRLGNGAVNCWGVGLEHIGWLNLPQFPEDNCPLLANTNQADGDGDMIGDVCDTECEEGLFFSRYVTAAMASSFVSGSNGGALAIYNPTSESINLEYYSIGTENNTISIGDIGGVGIGDSSVAANESFVICRTVNNFGGSFTSDDLCDVVLSSGFTGQDFEELFTTDIIRLVDGYDNLVDIMGPSPEGAPSNLGGIWLEDVQEESQFFYLKRKQNVTQGQNTFDASQWLQMNKQEVEIDLDELGFSNGYSGCQ